MSGTAQGDMPPGFDPRAYERAGIPADQARRWWVRRFSPDQAQSWTRAGVLDPIEAMRWTSIGVNPTTVSSWQSAGISANDAVRWHEFGFTAEDAAQQARQGQTPEQALEDRRNQSRGGRKRKGPSQGDSFGGFLGFTDGGDDPDPAQQFISAARAADGGVMLGYINRQWFDDEAKAWASKGIDISSALAWKELGLTPDEADRFVKRDLTPMAVAMEWWRAGIPADEAASWIGAGMEPQEAIKQREQGVTVDEAEVIRVLREKNDEG